MIQSIWDFFSLFPIFLTYTTLPLYAYREGDLHYIIAMLICLNLVNLFSLWLKEIIYLLPDKYAYWWLFRPNNACNCDTFNLGGDVGGKPGFPSGHSISIGFLYIVLKSYFEKKFPENKREVNFILLLFVITTLLSRYMKSCHNVIQIFVGFTLGYMFGLIFNKY